MYSRLKKTRDAISELLFWNAKIETALDGDRGSRIVFGRVGNVFMVQKNLQTGRVSYCTS